MKLRRALGSARPAFSTLIPRSSFAAHLQRAARAPGRADFACRGPSGGDIPIHEFRVPAGAARRGALYRFLSIVRIGEGLSVAFGFTANQSFKNASCIASMFVMMVVAISALGAIPTFPEADHVTANCQLFESRSPIGFAQSALRMTRTASTSSRSQL